VTNAGLIDTLKGAGPFTVFAPVDAAFAALPKATLDAVGADKALLTKVLTYHVVAGALNTDQLKDGKLKTVAGVELTVSHDKDGNVLVDGHPIAVANVQATNGVIHAMGNVLIPA
ncbi:MAG: fasciclin domain-containing protein, partial [Acidimicrobiia bacterium]